MSSPSANSVQNMSQFGLAGKALGWLASTGTSVRFRLGSPFSSTVVVYGDCLLGTRRRGQGGMEVRKEGDYITYHYVCVCVCVYVCVCVCVCVCV